MGKLNFTLDDKIEMYEENLEDARSALKRARTNSSKRKCKRQIEFIEDMLNDLRELKSFRQGTIGKRP